MNSWKTWDEKNITQNIYDNYFLYSSESLKNAYEDIDNLLKYGHYAW